MNTNNQLEDAGSGLKAPVAVEKQARGETPTLPGLDDLIKPFRFPTQPHEYKVISLRECPTPEQLALCDTPQKAADYFRLHLPNHPYFNPDVETFVVLLLNTRRRVKGHQIVSIGTHDTILVHPMSVFRLAVVCSASACILAHNHPSGQADPSDADIKVTRDLIRAGQLLKIEVLDHIIIGTGNPGFCSLRELGYFF